MQPIPRTDELAFLSDSLKVAASCLPISVIGEEHLERTKLFYGCLVKIRERGRVDFDPSLFNCFMGNINYVKIMTKIYDYSEIKNNNYEKLLDDLIDSTQKILEKKDNGHSNLLEDFGNFLMNYK